MENFYIFLDVDGVLNSDPFGFFEKIEKQNVKVLDNLLLQLKKRNFNPIIIISSNWRLYAKKYEKLKSTLAEMGLTYKNQYIKLDSGLNSVRGLQIIGFLNTYNIGSNFVIIDDNLDEIARFFPKKQILQTTSSKGLTQKNVDDYLYNHIKKHNPKKNTDKAF